MKNCTNTSTRNISKGYQYRISNGVYLCALNKAKYINTLRADKTCRTLTLCRKEIAFLMWPKWWHKSTTGELCVGCRIRTVRCASSSRCCCNFS